MDISGSVFLPRRNLLPVRLGPKVGQLFPKLSLYLRMDKTAPQRFARAVHGRAVFENEVSKLRCDRD